MDPAFIPPSVPAELASLLNAVSAPKEAQVQAALMRMLNQELDVLFEARVPEGVRLRLPQGQALIADGDLPYPEGTTLRVQVLPPPSGETAPRLRPLSVQLPPLPAILSPLVQGEAFPMLQRLQSQNPPVAYRALAALFQHLEALSPLPATSPSTQTADPPQIQNTELPTPSTQSQVNADLPPRPAAPPTFQGPLARAVQDPQPKASPGSLVESWLKLAGPSPVPGPQNTPGATRTLPPLQNPHPLGNTDLPTLPAVPPTLERPLALALQDLLPKESPESLVARWLKLAGAPEAPGPQATTPASLPQPSPRNAQGPTMLGVPPEPNPGQGPSSAVAQAKPSLPIQSAATPRTLGPSAPPAMVAPAPQALGTPTPQPQSTRVLVAPFTSTPSGNPLPLAAEAPAAPEAAAPPQPALLQDPGLPKEVREVLQRLWNSGAEMTPSGATLPRSTPAAPSLGGLPAPLRQELQAFLAPRLPAPPLEALLRRWVEAGPLPTPATPAELVAEALQVLTRPAAPSQAAAPPGNPILLALNPAPPELKPAMIPILRAWLAEDVQGPHPRATAPVAHPDQPQPPSTAQLRLEQDLARWPASAQLALAQVLGLPSLTRPGGEVLPPAPKDLAEAVVRWLQDLAPQAEGDADPTLKSAKPLDLPSDSKGSLPLRVRAALPEEIQRILNHPALPTGVKETAKAWFKAALAEPAPPQAMLPARVEAPEPPLPPLNLKALELDPRLLGSLEARMATADASVLTHAEPWEAWVKASLQTLASPQASPREAPFHALQALDGTAYFELPLPGRASGPLQLWVETEAPARDPASPPVHRVLLGLQFTAIGATRIGLMMAGQALSVRIWAEHPDLLQPGQEELRTALEAQGSQVSLQIAPLPSGSPDPRALAVGPGYRGLA